MARLIPTNLKLRKEIYQEALMYYRCHPDDFIEDVMEIPLNIYQKLLVRAFFKYSYSVWILCRGTGN